MSFQAVKTWKSSADPEYAAKKARIDQLYAIADGETAPAAAGAAAASASAGAADGPGDPEIVFCLDEFGPLNLQPRPGHQRPRRAGTAREPGEPPRPRRRATYHRTSGVRHLFGALDLASGKIYRARKKAQEAGPIPAQICRYLRGLYPPQVRIAIICDNYSPHLTTRKDKRVGDWAAANRNTEIACVPTNSSWMNRIEAQFTALREFALSQRHRPCHPPRAEQHDPPLHRLAQPPHQ